MFDRRSFITATGGALAALSLARPARASDMARVPRLRLGDSVGIVAPASADNDASLLERAMYTLRGMGLVPSPGRHVSDRDGYLAGTDRDRAADINAMFANPRIRAIFALRGGWGSARLLPWLDWDIIRANPKLLVGFSDITALHLAFAARAGFPTVHAPNISSRWDAASWNSLWRLAFTGEAPMLGGADDGARPDSPPPRTIRPGRARGRLLGGNLTVLSTLMGTPWLPDFEGAILFLEDVNEAEYRIDRMLNQLALAGILGRLAGVIFGQCTGCVSDDPDYAGFSVPELLDHYLWPAAIPAFAGANVGHVGNQLSLPVGAPVEMDADAGTIRLLRPIAE